MKLRTQCYLPEPHSEPADAMLGLWDLSKGLNRILLGYLFFLGTILVASGVVWYIVTQIEAGELSQTVGKNASVAFFAFVLFSGLAAGGSLTLIVRGKWLCLASAPEQNYAKWMMFLSILCIVASPFLNAGMYLVGESTAEARSHAGGTMSFAGLQREFQSYRDGMPELDARESIRIAGKVIGLLSSVFFVLFLRAVALCWGSQVRVRLAELYLLLMLLLAVGVFVLIRNPHFMLSRPRLLLGLGSGWLIAGLWYFGLIVSMSAGAATLLAQRSRQPGWSPAPRTAGTPRYGTGASRR